MKAPRTEAGVGPHDEVIIGLLDVKALYPSLDIDATADMVIETFQNSEHSRRRTNEGNSHCIDPRCGRELRDRKRGV